MASPRLAHAAVLCALVTASAAAQPLTRQECAQLLARDENGVSAREAATRNLTAAELRAPAAASLRRASEAVVESAADGALDAGRLCASLVAERVDADVLLTGYYRPVVPARRSRGGEFIYPLYALPDRAVRGLPRAAIDRGALEGRVAAVAWLNDPVEAFFIHVQGSAVLDTPEGRLGVGYAGSNERPYTSIGALLVRDGRMRREDVSMEALKAYLRAHPAEREAILHANERYIYFREVDEHAVGSLGVPLTDGRSVAADPAAYPPGSLLVVAPRNERAAGPPRLVVVQDRGSAIVGPARLDLYIGTGDDAGRIAGPLQERVDVYRLRLR
jgi:membrane-bound lytic murein transglycosylase A